ncbi:MAG: DUF302 domain-containing protein [Aliishimia sp.]
MKHTFFALAVLASSALPGFAQDMITKTSPHSVAQTMDRLQAAVEGAGATVFARVDHAAGAAKVEMDLRPTQLLIFGNPKLGTPVIQADQAAGLDLPMRVLVHEAADGSVQVSYHAPASLSEDHSVPAETPVLKMMTGALGKLTDKAVATE